MNLVGQGNHGLISSKKPTAAELLGEREGRRWQTSLDLAIRKLEAGASSARAHSPVLVLMGFAG
jgi:hypothetical protein